VVSLCVIYGAQRFCFLQARQAACWWIVFCIFFVMPIRCNVYAASNGTIFVPSEAVKIVILFVFHNHFLWKILPLDAAYNFNRSASPAMKSMNMRSPLDLFAPSVLCCQIIIRLVAFFCTSTCSNLFARKYIVQLPAGELVETVGQSSVDTGNCHRPVFTHILLIRLSSILIRMESPVIWFLIAPNYGMCLKCDEVVFHKKMLLCRIVQTYRLSHAHTGRLPQSVPQYLERIAFRGWRQPLCRWRRRWMCLSLLSAVVWIQAWIYSARCE